MFESFYLFDLNHVAVYRILSRLVRILIKVPEIERKRLISGTMLHSQVDRVGEAHFDSSVFKIWDCHTVGGQKTDTCNEVHLRILVMLSKLDLKYVVATAVDAKADLVEAHPLASLERSGLDRVCLWLGLSKHLSRPTIESLWAQEILGLKHVIRAIAALLTSIVNV